MDSPDEASGGERVPLKKGPWTSAEDAILVDYVMTHGDGNWNAVQRHSGLARCGKSCHLRWANHLRPDLKKGAFTPVEERRILTLHAKMGNKWARMAAESGEKTVRSSLKGRRIQTGENIKPILMAGPSCWTGYRTAQLFIKELTTDLTLAVINSISHDNRLSLVLAGVSLNQKPSVGT